MSVEIDFKHHPQKSWDELKERYHKDVVINVQDMMKDETVYILLLQDLIDIMKYKFENARTRNRKIYYKFNSKDETRHMQLNHFISSLIFWQPLIDIDKTYLLDETWIFDFSNFNAKTLMKYVNDKLLPVYDIDFASQNAMVDELYHNIINISQAFCPLMGMSVSLYDLHQLELRNPEVSSIMRDGVDESLTPYEIENEINRRSHRLVDILVNDDEDNDYKAFFASGAGLSVDQFREYVVRIGFKADINGNTVPIFIDNNFLLHGLNKPSYIFLNAISGRKSMILSKLSMGKPGAFSHKLVYQSVTSILRDDYERCDSIMTIDYIIHNDEMLYLLQGRYYYDNEGDLQLLDYEKDKHLIGKYIRFRSPATCASKEGVCKWCYGHLFDINKDLESAGALGGLKNTEPIGQRVLKSKHTQATSSADLSFNDDYHKLFETNNSSITLKDDSELDAELYIKLTNIQIEEMDDSEYFYVTSFDIIDSNNQAIHHIAEDNGAKFYLNDTMIEKAKLRPVELIMALEDLDDDDSLFTVEVKNKELTEPLRILNEILNNDYHCGAENLSEFCQIYADRLIGMNIKYELVHAEMIARSLIVRKSDILKFPDFTMAGNINDYRILKLNDGQLHHPSALVSLPYGYLRRQLVSTELYEKTSTGPLDALYASQLSQFLD